MKLKKNNFLLLIINLFILISTCIVTYNMLITGAGDGQVGNNMVGIGILKAFTIDSNILAGISALFTVIYILKNPQKRNDTNIKKISLLSLMSSTAVFLTLIVVIIFLIPKDIIMHENFTRMFTGQMFYFHILNPILACISYILIDDGIYAGHLENILSMLPMICYSIVYFLMVVVFQSWDDFYYFTFGNKFYLIPFVLIVVYIFTYYLGKVLILLHNKNVRKSHSRQ